MGRKILVVDDECDILNAIKEVLEYYKYTVISARDGLEAWAMIKTDEPDVILSDFRMPHLDGIGLFELVNDSKSTCHIPFIFMSATPEKLYQLNVHAVLRKPFEFENLMSHLNLIVDRN